MNALKLLLPSYMVVANFYVYGDEKITRNAHFTGFVRTLEYDKSLVHLPRQISYFYRKRL